MNKQKTQQKTKTVYGLITGLIIYAIIGSIGLYLLRTFWADYDIAGKDKSYTFEMKLARLFIGLLASIVAGITSTLIANDKGKAAWFIGIIIFCFAAYVHIFKVWADYPIWYHLSYLLPIIPITGLSHHLAYKRK